MRNRSADTVHLVAFRREPVRDRECAQPDRPHRARTSPDRKPPRRPAADRSAPRSTARGGGGRGRRDRPLAGGYAQPTQHGPVPSAPHVRDTSASGARGTGADQETSPVDIWPLTPVTARQVAPLGSAVADAPDVRRLRTFQPTRRLGGVMRATWSFGRFRCRVSEALALPGYVVAREWTR